MGEKTYVPGDEHLPENNEDDVDLPPPSTNIDEPPGPCPITILGEQNGLYAFLTARGAIRLMHASEFSKSVLRDLFAGRLDWLWKRFTVRDSGGNVKGWSADQCEEYLKRESARKPIFDPSVDMRGPGVWMVEGDKDTPDHVVVHGGDKIYINLPEWIEKSTDKKFPGWHPPMKYRGIIYALRRPEPKPTAKPSTREEIEKLMELLQTWSWLRPNIDPMLLLGWIAAATICGALDWRPSLWITGDRATGKSTLQDLVRRILGEILLQLADSTEAAVRQSLNGAARPVELDEFEAEEINYKRQQIVKLIRISSTRGSGKIARGSADGVAVFYNLDAVFLCSSILRPSLPPQDLTRFTMIDLDILRASPTKSTQVKARIRSFAGLGQKMCRRLLDRWDQLQGSLAMFYAALVKTGHTSRSADQYAVLLACADVMMNEDIVEGPACEAIVEALDPVAIAEHAGDETDARSCIQYLITATSPDWSGGKKPTIGNILREIAGAEASSEAHIMLQDIGLRLEKFDINVEGEPYRPPELCLAVSLRHQGLAKIFNGTVWGASSGRAGAWVQSLKRLPGVPPQPRNVRMNGIQQKAIIVPFITLDIDVNANRIDDPPPPPVSSDDISATS